MYAACIATHSSTLLMPDVRKPQRRHPACSSSVRTCCPMFSQRAQLQPETYTTCFPSIYSASSTTCRKNVNKAKHMHSLAQPSCYMHNVAKKIRQNLHRRSCIPKRSQLFIFHRRCQELFRSRVPRSRVSYPEPHVVWNQYVWV